MDPLASYLPQDRRQALAQGEGLPARTTGATLFADISGFTPLTEELTRALGARGGAETLSALLDQVYTALIEQVDQQHGSVISFAGDSVTCWFDDADGPAAPRAAASALGMQQTMLALAELPLARGAASTLKLKVAIAQGPARRLVVGDPSAQLFDVLAGATITRVAQIEQIAGKGEVLVDEPTAEALGAAARLGPWRANPADPTVRAAPLLGLGLAVPPGPWPSLRPGAIAPEALRPWLIPPVAAREAQGFSLLMTTFRPVVTLFMSCVTVDYEEDDASARLDAFIRLVTTSLARHGGTLLQLIVGDKGSYIYAGFGALVAHEDDARRAVLTALELRAGGDLRIGISSGTLRTGAYGAPTRRTYGALGDDVNLAARLMSLAAPGEVLISGRVQQALGSDIALVPRVPIRLKGKAEPLPVFAVTGISRRRAIRLEEPGYSLPMVGREIERAAIVHLISRAVSGRGQVVSLIAEAGMGKSRLVAETIRLAQQQGMLGYGGACQSYGTAAPYLVWGPIWQAFFDLDPGAPPRRQTRALEQLVAEWAPERIEALPLLGPLVGLSLPENEFTASLAPQHRRGALHALLLDCVRAAAGEAAQDGRGLLFVLEDLQWIDALAHDLLEELARTIAELPVLIVLAYRPPEIQRLQAPRVETLPNFTRITLDALGAADTEHLIRAKLAQLFPERGAAAPARLLSQVTARTQGNPFFVEELLNYLRDLGVDPQDEGQIDALELPASLHSLVLSRIDQLPPRQQAVLQVASVVGRRFRHSWLHEAFPLLGGPEPLRADLDDLARLELTSLDTPEPELAYLFKHIVTQEVAYATLASQTRAALHEQFAAYLERQAGDDADTAVDLLAYHYERSDDLVKKRAYLRRAGEVAANCFANHAAVQYLSRALALAPPEDEGERYALLLCREQIYSLQAARADQARDLEELQRLAEASGDQTWLAESLLRRASYALLTSDFAAVLRLVDQALALVRELGDTARECRAYQMLGSRAARLGELLAADDWYEQALAAARAIGAASLEGAVLGNRGIVAWYRGELAAARAYHERVIEIARAHGNHISESYALGNLGLVAASAGNYAEARACHEQSLRISRAVGDRAAEGRTLNNLGEVAAACGDYASAREYVERSLALARQSEARPSQSVALAQLGAILLDQGDARAAQLYLQQGIEIAQALGLRQTEAGALTNLGRALVMAGWLDEAEAALSQALAIWRELGSSRTLLTALVGLAEVAMARGEPGAAAALAEQALGHLAPAGDSRGADDLRERLICSTVLAAVGNPRAPGILAEAHRDLIAAAAQIPDEPTRQMFLEQVPWHRAISAAWQAWDGG